MPLPLENKRKWNPWPVALVAFFTVAIVSAVGFVVFCSFHASDLVAKDYYEQELRFQAQMEQQQRADALTSPASVSYDRATRQIQILIPQAASASVSGTLTFYRPSAAGLDRRISLNLDRSGAQALNAADLAPGLWKLKLLWKCNGQDYLVEETMVAAGSAAAGPTNRPNS